MADSEGLALAAAPHTTTTLAAMVEATDGEGKKLVERAHWRWTEPGGEACR